CYEILSTNGDENDLAHPSIVAFPSAENQFQIDLGTEDKSIPIHESARYFDCDASLQCVDRTELIPKHHLSPNLQKRTINEQVYKDILTEIKRKRALVILIVDLFDIANSVNRS
ncbi:unnamed protein product, partial [Rotaria sordida]